MAVERLLRFTLGRESFGLRLRDAGSLVNLAAASRVPLAPEAIAGVADVRGRVVTLVSLPRLAGLPDEPGVGRRAVLLATPWEHLAIEVGEQVDLLSTDLDRARPAEQSVERAATAFRGLLTAEGVLLNLIQPAALAAACERRVRERFRLAG
jgi:chemotaxis signal transduction protein